MTDVLSDDSNFPSAEDLHSEERRLLQHMKHVVGARHVSLAYVAALSAPWLVQEAFGKELQNWYGAFEIIQYISMPQNANYIRSHAFCKIKTANDDRPDSHLSLKTRIVLHGNKDKEKYEVRKDTQAASFTAISILITLAAPYNNHIASLDIKSAYLQSDPCKRYIFVWPPNEWPGGRGVVWKLLKLPYRFSDAGHQWQEIIDEFIFLLEFIVILGIPQLFLHVDASRSIDAVVANITDGILIGAYHRLSHGSSNSCTRNLTSVALS
jgi:hypothetical protein